MLIIKALFLQLYWLLIVIYGRQISPLLLISLTVLLLIINYYVYVSRRSAFRYCLIIFIFTVLGYIHDKGMIILGIIDRESYHYTYLLLWSIFIGYYGDIFRKLEKKTILQIFLGATGGCLAYYSALNFGSWKVSTNELQSYMIYTSIFWAIFFPFSFNIYNKIYTG